MAELRSLARYCEFKDSLEDMLRDRLVCGVNDAHIQKRLLGDAELTFEKAFAVAMGFEAAAKGAQEVVKVEPGRDKTVEEVHAVMKRSTDERTGKCFRCGRRNHTAGQCPHIESVCYNCGKKGHIQRTCRQPRKGDKEEQSEV